MTDNPNKSNQSVEVYQLRIRLLTISPMISRRILVRSDTSIAHLHMVIQCVMGWSNERLHQFTIRGVRYGANYLNGLHFIDNGNKVRLYDFNFYDRERFRYEYDMFDHWQHEIRLEKRLQLDETVTYPICISGRGKTPPEGCGGADRFQALRNHYGKGYVTFWMLDLLKPLAEDKDAELDIPALRQASYWYTIEQFDCKQANQRIAAWRAGEPHMHFILGG